MKEQEVGGGIRCREGGRVGCWCGEWKEGGLLVWGVEEGGLLVWGMEGGRVVGVERGETCRVIYFPEIVHRRHSLCEESEATGNDWKH